jgi:hypothetical protein
MQKNRHEFVLIHTMGPRDVGLISRVRVLNRNFERFDANHARRGALDSAPRS